MRKQILKRGRKQLSMILALGLIMGTVPVQVFGTTADEVQTVSEESCEKATEAETVSGEAGEEVPETETVSEEVCEETPSNVPSDEPSNEPSNEPSDEPVLEEEMPEEAVTEAAGLTSDEIMEIVNGNTRQTIKVPGGKLYFEPDTGTIAWADGDMEELTIPESFEGKEIRLIGRWALSGLKKLKKINLPENRNILGEGSLAELASLEEFTVPEGYDNVPKQCFYGCPLLKKVSLPASITSIGESAFYKCPSLEYVDVPGNCSRIGRMAFYSCTGLKGIAFVKDSSCDLSGWGIFYNCLSLEKVVNIPNMRLRMFYESGKRAEKWLDTDEMRANQTEMWRLKYGTESDPKYWLDDEDLVKQRQNAIKGKAEEITKSCTNDREKIEAVMKWVDDHIEYEMGHDNHPWAIYTGIQEVEAGTKEEQLNSCGGYSAMTQVLLQALGIPCATLWREARNGESIDHVFCAAYFEDKWRWLDTTHSDNRKEGLELDVRTPAFFADSDHRVDYMLYHSSKGEDIYKELPLDIPVEEDVKDWPDQNPADAYKLGETGMDRDWVHETDPALIQAEKDKIAARAAQFPDIPESDEDIFGFDDATGTITSMKNYTVSQISIPAKIRGVSVNAIGDKAMQNLKNLEYLAMPDTITEIGKYGLANNRKLKRVHLSAGLTELKEGILQGCSSLDSVTIPKNVKRLDRDLFRNCSSLEEALFEDYDFKIKVIETDPMGSDNYYETGQADISWYCFAGMSGRALHGLDFHETYTGTKYHRQLQAVELTDDWRQNIVKIHQSQRGYREGFSPYHLDGSNSKPFRLSNKAVDYEWGHFAEPSRFTGYQPATWCRAFIDWAYAMAGVYGYKSTEYEWKDTVYAGNGGTVELEPGDMLGMGKSHWCMVGSVKDQGDLLEIWIIHGNHGDRMVMDEVRHYNKKTGKATDMDDEDYDYFRAIYKIDFSGLQKQTVALDAGEGKCDVKSRIYCKGAYYGALPDAEREDYVFDGWYTEPGGKGKKAYPYRNLTDDVTTLYANYIYNPKAVKGVALDRKSVKLQLGCQLKLNAAVKPADAENPSVSWRSGNDEVVSVKDGVIKGLQEGKATIMARTDAGPYVAYCEVEVTAEGGEGGTDDPDDVDEPSDDDGDGIRKGDLEDGQKIPEAIWIGGLKKKYTYTGKPVKPDFRVYYKDHRLVAGLDYTVSYKNNINVGTAAVITVKFCNNFKGSKGLTFEIEKNPLTKGTVTADPQVTGYKKGKKNNNIRPQIMTDDGTVLKYTDRDFRLEYRDAKTGQDSTCEETGDYTIHMTAKNESRGYVSGASIDVPLTVTDKPFMKGVKVTGKTKLAYTGKKMIPVLTLKYAGKKLDSSYYTVDTVSGDDYRYPGSHTLVLKGDGVNLFGVRRITYKITGKRKLGDNKYTSVTLSAGSLDEEGSVPYAYGGAKPEVIVTYRGNLLKKGRDYKLAYKNNKKAGKKAELTVKGIGKYSGSRKVGYTVSKRKLSDLILIVNDRAESAKAEDYKKTKLMFFSKDGFVDQKLTKADYKADFKLSSDTDTPKAGDTVTVTVSAGSAGNFEGKVKAEFSIIDGTKDIGKAKVSVHNGKPYAYTGKEIRPEGDDVSVKLQGAVIGAENYEISYYNNVNRGKNAAILLKGKNGYGGVKVVRFRIGSAAYE